MSYNLDENSSSIKEPLSLSLKTEKKDGSFDLIKSTDILFADKDKLKFPLVLRTWQEGDWFIPIGMRGKKKLSDFFSDNKFSLLEKENTWILLSGDEIVWIVGQRPDDRYKVTDKTQTVLKIELTN